MREGSLISIKKQLFSTALAFLTAGLVAPSVHAQNWTLLLETPDAKIHYDASSLRRQDGIVRTWAIFDYKTPKSNSSAETYRSMRIREEVRCSDEKSRTVSLAIFEQAMAQGKMLFVNERAADWGFSPPGSLGFKLLEFCK